MRPLYSAYWELGTVHENFISITRAPKMLGFLQNPRDVNTGGGSDPSSVGRGFTFEVICEGVIWYLMIDTDDRYRF